MTASLTSLTGITGRTLRADITVATLGTSVTALTLGALLTDRTSGADGTGRAGLTWRALAIGCLLGVAYLCEVVSVVAEGIEGGLFEFDSVDLLRKLDCRQKSRTEYLDFHLDFNYYN